MEPLVIVGLTCCQRDFISPPLIASYSTTQQDAVLMCVCVNIWSQFLFTLLNTSCFPKLDGFVRTLPKWWEGLSLQVGISLFVSPELHSSKIGNFRFYNLLFYAANTHSTRFRAPNTYKDAGNEMNQMQVMMLVVVKRTFYFGQTRTPLWVYYRRRGG